MTAAHPRPVALITGASRRVGAVVARTLHAAGYDLALHYRHSSDEAEALAKDLEAQRPNSTLLLQADLSDLSTLKPLIEKQLAHFGRLDALINNASAFYATPLDSATPTQWDELFASNAQAPFFLTQAAIPALRKAGGGIVNMLDIYAERPLAGYTLYCMAKASLAAMTRSLALELGPDIRVNGIAPGAVLWPSEGKSEQEQNELLSRTPLKRAGTPEDVASAILWLLRDAHYTTGQVIHVDGGRILSI
jgi:pteridine reductase